MLLLLGAFVLPSEQGPANVAAVKQEISTEQKRLLNMVEGEFTKLKETIKIRFTNLGKRAKNMTTVKAHAEFEIIQAEIEEQFKNGFSEMKVANKKDGKAAVKSLRISERALVKAAATGKVSANGKKRALAHSEEEEEEIEEEELAAATKPKPIAKKAKAGATTAAHADKPAKKAIKAKTVPAPAPPKGAAKSSKKNAAAAKNIAPATDVDIDVEEEEELEHEIAEHTVHEPKHGAAAHDPHNADLEHELEQEDEEIE